MGSDRRAVPCYFDGACKGNQFTKKGPMWVAYVIGEEEHVHEVADLPSLQGPLRSNNLAEYQALLLLLRRLRGLAAGVRVSYIVHGDSQLVVYQMTGRYAVRDPKLLPLHQEAMQLAAGLPVTFNWVPRDRNRAGHLLE